MIQVNSPVIGPMGVLDHLSCLFLVPRVPCTSYGWFTFLTWKAAALTLRQMTSFLTFARGFHELRISRELIEKLISKMPQVPEIPRPPSCVLPPSYVLIVFYFWRASRSSIAVLISAHPNSRSLGDLRSRSDLAVASKELGTKQN